MKHLKTFEDTYDFDEMKSIKVGDTIVAYATISEKDLVRKDVPVLTELEIIVDKIGKTTNDGMVYAFYGHQKNQPDDDKGNVFVYNDDNMFCVDFDGKEEKRIMK